MQKIKPKLYTMKVDPIELEKWHLFAKSKDLPLSDVIKKLMNNQELPETIEPKKKERRRYSAADPNLLRELNAIGNNINQIARRVNKREKFEILVELNAIEKHLQELLNVSKIH